MADKRFDKSPNAKICAAAAQVLLYEMVGFAQDQKLVYIEGSPPNEKLVLKLESKEYPNLRDGEAQTLEVDKTLLSTAMDIFKKLGVTIDDNIAVSQPTNDDGGVTFSRGTLHGDDRQTYRSRIEIKVDVSKISLNIAKRIAEEGEVAKQINMRAIGRIAELDCNEYGQRAETYFALLKKELETAGLSDVLPPILESSGNQYAPFEYIKINVAEMGVEDARILVDAMKSVSVKLNNQKKIERDDAIAAVPGMSDVPEHWEKILGALGCDVASVERMFEEQVHTVKLATPITKEAFLQLAGKLNMAANQVKKAEGYNLKYLAHITEKSDTPEQPESKLTIGQSFASMISYRMPQKTPRQPAAVTEFIIGFGKIEKIPSPVDDTMYNPPPEPLELIDLLKGLEGYNWERLASTSPITGGRGRAAGDSSTSENKT